MHFLLLSVIKIAKDYLRESTVQQRFWYGQYSYSLTNQNYLPQFNSPGRGRSTKKDGSRLTSLSDEK